MSNDNAAPARASLPKVIRKGFRDAYDHLGYVVFVTLTVSIVVMLILSLAALISRPLGGVADGVKIVMLLLAVFVAYICAVGVYYYVNKTVFREHPALLDTVVGIRLLIKPALALFVVDLVITTVLGVDFAFFFMQFMRSQNILFAVLACLIGYVSVIWLIIAMYHVPLLVAQLSMESGTGVWVILRKSFLLMADNPGFTVGLFVVIIAFTVLCAIPVFIGIAVMFLGASAFLITHALRELFVKYGIVEEDPEVVFDGWPKDIKN